MEKSISLMRAFRMMALIIIVIVYVLVLVFIRAVAHSRKANCASRERDLLLAYMMYTADYDKYSTIRPEDLKPYTSQRIVSRCPANKSGDYLWNAFCLGKNGDPQQDSQKCLLLGEGKSSGKFDSIGQLVWPHSLCSHQDMGLVETFSSKLKRDGANLGFLDGHVKSFAKDELPDTIVIKVSFHPSPKQPPTAHLDFGQKVEIGGQRFRVVRPAGDLVRE